MEPEVLAAAGLAQTLLEEHPESLDLLLAIIEHGVDLDCAHIPLDLLSFRPLAH